MHSLKTFKVACYLPCKSPKVKALQFFNACHECEHYRRKTVLRYEGNWDKLDLLSFFQCNLNKSQQVQGILLTKPDKVKALWLWYACSETKHKKYSQDIVKTGTPTAKSFFLQCTVKNTRSWQILLQKMCNAMLLMRKSSLSVKTGLLHQKNRNIETPDI